jgi:hypothetical protein
MAEELFRQVAAFASFGFAKSHAAAFARTAYESSFLKLFYPAQFLVGLVNAQPMGFYPVEVLVNDAKRHGVTVLPVDVATRRAPDHDRVGGPARRALAPAGDGAHDGTRRCRPDAGIPSRPRPVRSPACVIPSAASRERPGSPRRRRLGCSPGAPPRQGDRRGARQALLDGELARGPTRRCRTSWNGPVSPKRCWSGSSGRWARLAWASRAGSCSGSCGRWHGPAKGAPKGGGRVAGRPLDLRLPATPAPDLPPLTELGAARGQLCGPLARRAAAGGRALPSSPGAPGCGHECRPGGATARTPCGSAAWS